MRLIYVIGIPGAGKTTAVRAALRPYTRLEAVFPFAYEEVYTAADGPPLRLIGAHLGVDRAPFGGTDALGMAVQPRVLEWLEAQSRLETYPVVIGEGDRLGNRSFLEAAAELCDVTVVRVATMPEIAEVRRAQRSNTVQNSSWVAGRITKVNNLRDLVTVHLDGEAPAHELGAELRSLITQKEVPA